MLNKISKNYVPKVSVLTPAWNRAEYLPKVYASLVSQTIQDIEWIVVDDGSEDTTIEVMQKLISKATFPIIFISYNKRVGKCRADNTLLDLAQADNIVWCDSDDILLPNTLEILLARWNSIPSKDKNNYIAIIGRCSDNNGNLQDTGSVNFKAFSCKWSELSTTYNMRGDMCIMINTKIVSKKRFPEVDLVMSESGFWKQFMENNIVCIPDILKVVTRDTNNRISGSSRMEYCRGKAHTILLADKKTYSEVSWKKRVNIASKLVRYSLHGDLEIIVVKEKFGLNSKKLSFKIGTLLGYILAVKDRLQKRVDKSHVIFKKGLSAKVTLWSNIDKELDE